MNQMESLLAKFFWGSNSDSKATHWISWDRICLPRDEGGLGIRKFKDTVDAFSLKLWWRFRMQDSLWARFMLSKYCHATGPASPRVSKTHSHVWKRMTKASNKAQAHIRWSLGDGNLDFWADTWVHEEPLRLQCSYQNNLPRLQVKDLWNGNNWDEPKVRTILTPLGVPPHTIEKILVVPIDGGDKDIMRWDITPHGNFSTTSAWSLVRQHQPRNDKLDLIWSQVVSPSISIFVWRLLANRLPVDEKLQSRSIQLVSKCRCCTIPKTESREHLFLQGEGASKVWEYFTKWFPNDPHWQEDNWNVEYRMWFWSNQVNNPKTGHARCTIPMLITWNIWTERNDAIHTEKKFNASDVISRINSYLHWSMLAKKMTAQHWTGCCPQVGIMNPRDLPTNPRKWSIIKWEAPPLGWIKVNSDGAYSPSTERAGGGGVIRDSQGMILEGFMSHFKVTSSLDAELQACLMGCEKAHLWGKHVWIETDSQQLINLATGKDRGAANIRHRITMLRNLVRSPNCRITHIHREGNKIADWLAKQGSKRESELSFNHDSAPTLVKALAFLDRIGLPSVREVIQDDMG